MDGPFTVSIPLLFIWTLYLFPAVILPILAAVLLLFVPPFYPLLFGQFIAFVGIIVYPIYGVLKLLEYGLNRHYEANQVRDVKQDKLNFLVGFGGIIISTIFPRVAIYFVDGMTSLLICLMAIVSILLLTAIFLSHTRKTVSELNYNDHGYTSIWVLGIHVFIFMISLRPALSMKGQIIRVIISQILFGINSLSSTLDFIVVWNDGFILDTPRAPVEAPKVEQTKTSRASFTDFSAVTLGCLSILTLIYGFRVLGGETIQMAIVGCAVIFGGVWGLAVILSGVSAKRKMLIGLGAMGIIGFVPRIVHGVLINAVMPNLLISTIITLSLTLSIYYHFYYSNRHPVFHFQYEANESLIAELYIWHSLIFIAMIRISYGYWRSSELEVIILSQLAFFLLPFTSSIDFWMIWNDAAVLEDEKQDVKETNTKVVKKRVVKLRPPKITCSSCHQGYNEKNKTPRILKECGHTICEQCANRRLAENNDKHLFCPICRKVTVVRGAANTLVKNYLMLEMVEEIKSM